MTNEEKAKEIIKISDTKDVYDIVDFQSLEEALKDDLMEMAKWKDEQNKWHTIKEGDLPEKMVII